MVIGSPVLIILAPVTNSTSPMRRSVIQYTWEKVKPKEKEKGEVVR